MPKYRLCLLAIIAITVFQSQSSAQVIFSRSFSLEGGGAEADLEALDMPIGSIITSAIGGEAGSYFPSPRLPSDTAQLLRMPQVVEELSLDDEQSAAISSLSKAMGRQISDVMKNIEFGGEDSGRIIQEAQRAIRSKTQEKLEEVLTPGQLDRLNQIKVQSALKTRGAMALTSGFLGDQIRLTDKQKSLLRTINAQKQAKLRSEIQALKEKYLQETLDEVLEEDQQKKLANLIGKRYEIRTPDFRSMIQRRAKEITDKAAKDSASKGD